MSGTDLGSREALPATAARLAWRFGRTRPGRELTDRERQVLALFAAGASTDETALTLYVTRETVKRHAQNVYAKLGANNRTHAVATLLLAVSWDDEPGGENDGRIPLRAGGGSGSTAG